VTANKGRRRLAANIASLGIVQVANYVFPIITIPVISRIIGPDKLGVINFASAYIAYFTLLIGFGFDLTATRKVARDPDNAENRNKVFSEVFISQAILLAVSAVCFIISFFLVPQLNEERAVAIFTFLTCFATLFTQNWLFQAMQDLPKVAILNLLTKIVFTIIIFATIHKKSDYVWQPLATSFAQVVVAIASFWWSIKKYNLKLKMVKLADCMKLLWADKSFFLSLCVVNVYSSTSIVVLGLFQSSTQVGYYTAGQKLIMILQGLVSIPLATAFFPYIGRAFAESHEKGLKIAQQLIPIVFVLTGLAGIVIFAASPLFIQFFYGPKFEAAVSVCRILAFIPMLVGLNTILGIHIMMNLKLDNIFFAITCVGAVVGLILNIALVKVIGYTGPAYTWLIIEILNLVLLYVMLRRRNIESLNFSFFRSDFFIQYIKLLLDKFRPKQPEKAK
jgi:O-antigen/teichoic acid export membrane protein